jgi:GH24 family phage-related lysozyme (muramidase)
MNPLATQFIKEFESLSLKLYKATKDGNWTIGYGHECSPNEVNLFKNGIGQDLADSILQADIRKHVPKHKDFDKLPENQQAAMISFNFNAGKADFILGSVEKEIKSEHTRRFLILSHLLKYGFSQGKPLDGLIKRRFAEAALMLGRDWLRLKNTCENLNDCVKCLLGLFSIPLAVMLDEVVDFYRKHGVR